MKRLRVLSKLFAAPTSAGESSPLGAGWPGRIRFAALALGMIGGVALILSQVHEHYPIQKWLFWRYAAYWGLMLVFSAACLSAGHRISTWLFPRRVPVAEHLVTSFSLGVLTFFGGMFGAGVVGLWRPWLAIAWPLVLIASGIVPAVRYGRRLSRHLRWARRRPHPAESAWKLVVLGFGLLGLTAVYFVTLSPKNIAYDAQWYHLAIAEQYVAAGGIERFAEGWYKGANPQLASILYGWGFLLPWTKLFDRAMICVHLEFLLFVWTLAGVPPLVRRLLHGRRVPYAWVATFLFPGLFLYDSSLSAGADHVSAFWAIPIFLALLRAWSEPGPRRTIVLGAFIAGAMLTKYTAVSIALAPILVMVGRSLWVGIVSLVRKAPKAATSAWLGLGAFALSGMVVSAPHWLKNWLWYGDPVYPALSKHFTPHPWTVDSARFFSVNLEGRLVSPDGTLAERAWETLKTLFTFSFVPHNYPFFHHDVPVFGFLFTVASVLLLTFKRTARVWGLVFVIWIGMAIWLSIHARDRYLQALLPWMVAVTVAVIVLAWRSHWLHRVLMSALVGVQIIWGSDVPFFRTHQMIHDSPFKATVDLIATGFEGNYEKRLKPFGMMEKVGDTLPPDAKVLVHDVHLTLGLRNRRVSDAAGRQGAIVYGRMRSTRETYDLLRSLGVTHVLWNSTNTESLDSVAGSFVFLELVRTQTTDVKRFGSWRLGRLMLTPPPERPFPENVALLTCGSRYAVGMYRRSDLIVPGLERNKSVYPAPHKPLSSAKVTLKSLIGEADYVAWNPKCQKKVERGWLSDFRRLGRRGDATDLYVRKRPR
jgi:hypothetical protein